MANESEPDRWRHHARMNAVIDEVAAEYPHVDVCDVRQVVDARATSWSITSAIIAAASIFNWPGKSNSSWPSGTPCAQIRCRSG